MSALSIASELQDQIAWWSRRLNYTGRNDTELAKKSAAPNMILELQTKIDALLGTQQTTTNTMPTVVQPLQANTTTQTITPSFTTPTTNTTTGQPYGYLVLIGVGLYLLTGGFK